MRLGLLLLAFFFLGHSQGLSCPGKIPPPPSNAHNTTDPYNPSVLRWPFITGVEEGVATITWGMLPKDATNGSVSWSLDGKSYGSPVASSLKVLTWWNYEDFPPLKSMKQFSSVLTSLPISTPICYRVFVDGEEVATFSFTTAPKQTSIDKIQFSSWGDFGVGQESKPWYRTGTPQAQVRDALWSKFNDSDFFLALGDDTYFFGKPHEYDQRTFNYYYEQWARIPLFLTPGNHDYEFDLAGTYLDVFPQKKQKNIVPDHQGRYYSFEWGPVHFTSIDTEWTRYDQPSIAAGSKMLKWLEEDLSSTKKPWKVVFMHKMPYTEDSIADTNITQFILPIFESYGVQIVLGGHWHDYQRYPPLKAGVVTPIKEGGVTYIISGGGGYQVDGKMEGNHDDEVLIPRSVVPPTIFKGVYHFCYWTFTNCSASLTAYDIALSPFDSSTFQIC